MRAQQFVMLLRVVWYIPGGVLEKNAASLTPKMQAYAAVKKISRLYYISRRHIQNILLYFVHSLLRNILEFT
jgi:hypothetical protein